MICTNMDKRSAKIIFFAVSMEYSVCSVRVLKEPFSRKLMKYGFNHRFAMVDDEKFWSTIRFSENVLLYLFQLHQWLPDRKCIMLGCYMLKNWNRWKTTRRKSYCQCMQQNSMARERRTNHLRQEAKHHVVKRNYKILLNIYLWEWH